MPIALNIGHLMYNIANYLFYGVGTMAIYAYKCSACNFEQDIIQKMSDAELSICPTCGKDSFSKQLTAAGFQLKGGGYYATDFKTPSKAEPAPACGTGACPACV